MGTMVVSREYRAVVAPYVTRALPLPWTVRSRHLGRDHGVVTVIKVKGLGSSPATKGEAACSLENERHAHRCSRHPCAAPHRLPAVVTSRQILLLWHWRNMAYWRRWRVRENISFLRGEETEETAVATRRVIRLTTVNPQMDIRSKFTLSPARGTAADARKNKGAFSRSLVRQSR